MPREPVRTILRFAASAEITGSSGAWDLHAVRPGPIGNTQSGEPCLPAIGLLVKYDSSNAVLTHVDLIGSTCKRDAELEGRFTLV